MKIKKVHKVQAKLTIKTRQSNGHVDQREERHHVIRRPEDTEPSPK